MQRVTRSRKLALPLLLVLACLVAPVPIAADECASDLRVDLDTEDQDGAVTRLQFTVDVSVGVDCAKITYELVLDVLSPDGKVSQVRKLRDVKLNGGSLTQLVSHKMAADSRLVDYEVQLVQCEVCALGV